MNVYGSVSSFIRYKVEVQAGLCELTVPSQQEGSWFEPRLWGVHRHTLPEHYLNIKII